jgi:hypothetical protein
MGAPWPGLSRRKIRTRDLRPGRRPLLREATKPGCEGKGHQRPAAQTPQCVAQGPSARSALARRVGRSEWVVVDGVDREPYAERYELDGFAGTGLV